ncbi:o-succinylbenzoate--CoA ligase [Luteococcus sp. H138]|uniref:AMP-binding enzyme n=1 Tax=unclassified Luteococcus TaxID=2639923 RepID=UPI00313D425E
MTHDVEPVDVLACPDPVEAFWRSHAERRLIALATSGTSAGQPRVIVRSTDSWVGSFDACAARLGLGRGSRFWIPGPLHATMNLFAACLATHVGASWSMSREGASHGQLTPALLRTLLDADPPAGLHVLVAGDGLHPGLRRTAEAAGLTVSHYYGAAELSMVAWGQDSQSLELFDDVDAEIRDGVLWVRSPWLSRVQTDERGFASVGDLAELDGSWLRVLGRPGAVTTAGATVELAPIEGLLQAQATGRVVVFAIPDDRMGELVCCATTPDDRERVRAWARAHLDGAHRPRRWLTYDGLPVTPAGKVDRAALPGWLLVEGPSTSSGSVNGRAGSGNGSNTSERLG